MNKQQTERELQKLFFSRKLDFYIRIPKQVQKGYSEYKDKNGAYPLAYNSRKELRNWISDLVDLFDQNKILLDDTTYNYFEKLNTYLLTDANSLNELKLTGDKLDAATIKLGLQNHDDIQKMSLDIVNSAKEYINKSYNA